MTSSAITLERPDWRRGLHRIGQKREDIVRSMPTFMGACPDFRETLELYDHACLAFEFWMTQSGDSAQDMKAEYSTMCDEMLGDILRFFP